jgi:hypothetical protein
VAEVFLFMDEKKPPKGDETPAEPKLSLVPPPRERAGRKLIAFLDSYTDEVERQFLTTLKL